MNIQDRLIIALDYPDQHSAIQMITKLGENISHYKVGLELFLNTRGEILSFLEKEGKKIFLDLKFHDIPNTTAAAARFAASLPMVTMFNIHSSGGKAMISAAAKEKRDDQILIGVTVLTSLENNDISQNFNSSLNTKELAVNLAIITKESGANGVVCSPLEAKAIKEACGDNFVTVCPGIRFSDSNVGDQKRILGPGDAIKNKADFIVMGRPITEDSNPAEAAKRALEEITHAL
ncbi:MAG: orotidine-5'-phosphate decarboxylase [Brevinema sp.]